MSAAAWLALLGTWTIAVMSPGPDFLALLRASLRSGATAGRQATFGVVCGIAVWITLALAGVTALISSHPALWQILRWAGAVLLFCYGVWILVSALRGWRAARVTTAAPQGDASDGSAASLTPRSTPVPAADAPPQALSTFAANFRLGFLTNTVGNPKALVFFGALFSSILPPGLAMSTTVFVAVSMVVIAAVWFLLMATVASRPRFVRAYRRAELPIDICLGVLFTVLGALLLPL